MKIIKQGRLTKKKTTLTYECGVCGCIWQLEDSEFPGIGKRARENSFLSMDHIAFKTRILEHKCPCCGALTSVSSYHEEEVKVSGLAQV